MINSPEEVSPSHGTVPPSASETADLSEDRPICQWIGKAPIPLSGGGQYLFTTWPDGSAEYCWRPTPSSTWGPPEPLEVAP